MVELGSLKEWAGGLGGLVILFILFRILNGISTQRAEYGTPQERQLEAKTGMGGAGKAIMALISAAKRRKGEEKGVEKGEKRAKNVEKKGRADKGEVEAAESAVKETRTAEAEESVEEFTEAAEGRGVGLVASVRSVLQSVAAYMAREKPSMQKQEVEVQQLDELMRRIRSTANYATIDARVADYLKQLFYRISEVIVRTTEDEHEKEAHQGELLRSLREAVKEAREVIGAARKAVGMLAGAERKERRLFKSELREIGKAIRDKQKELSGISKDKNADRTMIMQLQRGINLLQQQQGMVQQLNAQLQRTYSTMDRETKEMKRLLGAVAKSEGQVSKHEKSAEKREKGVTNRYSTLRKLATAIEETDKRFTQGSNPHEMAISFSGELNRFYKAYSEIVKGDLVFDEELREMLLLKATIAMQMEAYERLSISLAQAEEAVDAGLAAATGIIAAVLGGQDQKAGLQQLRLDLKKAGGELNYETRVEQFMQNLTRQLEMWSQNVGAQIGALINEDRRLLQEIENTEKLQSSGIGGAMATMVNRKIQIDSNYMSQARTFEQQLSSRNNMAAQAYRQAIGLESAAQGMAARAAGMQPKAL